MRVEMPPPPVSRTPRPRASKSRFHEGSMNDRVSATPPVHFLGPEDRALLERPAEMEKPTLRPARSTSHLSQQSQSSPLKKGSNILGQVWEGVRGKLRLRRDPVSNSGNASAVTPSAVLGEEARKKASQDSKPAFSDRPTREEAIANYHHLVASGFFSSHAIQSTRHAHPRSRSQPRRPSSQHSSSTRKITISESMPVSPTIGNDMTASSPLKPLSPNSNWPLVPGRLNPGPRTPTKGMAPSPRFTPASATSVSSRGTKRAADDYDDEMEEDGNNEIKIHIDEVDKKPEDAPHNKIRKVTSREFASTPKPIHPAITRSQLPTRRTTSASSVRSNHLPPVIVQQREPKKLTRKPLAAPSAPKSEFPSFDLPDRAASLRRNVSDNCYTLRAVGSGAMSTRASRPRRDGLSVIPNANRGIPRVPAIPTKFTFLDDDENQARLSRGLRR